jgi:hypothetical protein
MKITFVPTNPAVRERLCDGVGEGGVNHYYSVHAEWELATCRTNCDRGIGFRCGRRASAVCNNGSVDVITHPGSCPNGATAYPYTRYMAANLTFYRGGDVKLTFLAPMPVTEIGNTDFEIEANEAFDLPDGIMLDGTKYDGFQTIIGIYKIDYSDGQYGSVTIPTVLIAQ